METIKRIANLSPGDAEAHYRRALLGETSYSSLLTLHAMLERQARDDEDERKLRLDLDEVARRILTDLADMGPCRRIEPGEMARSFKADLEFESASDAANASAIALVSPSWKPPGDRLAAEDVCANILAGSLAFSRVYYVASAGTDWERVWRTVTRTRADLSLIRPIFLL